MALYKRHATITGPTADQLIPRRLPSTRHASVTSETALRHSAVWACLRLRANLFSTLPLDVYREVQGRAAKIPTPPVLRNPGGEKVDIQEWLYSTQVDLDQAGNAVGIIRSFDSLGLPTQIDLAPLNEVSFIVRKGELVEIRIADETFRGGAMDFIWHEKQYTKSGLHVGLSPLAYAAWTIGGYLSVQEFATDWFSNAATPSARLQHKHKVIDKDQAVEVKQRYKDSVQAGDLFVYGADWEYDLMGAKASESQFIEAMGATIADIARWFDCPVDRIESAVQGSSITYARVDLAQLQLLVNHLGPAIARREKTFTNRLLPRPRYVKFNTKALLRMDAKTQAEIFQIEVGSRLRTPDEARELMELEPFTEADYAQYDRLFGSHGSKEDSLARTIQQLYLGVGKIITVDEARTILNETGANLPVPAPPELEPAPATPAIPGAPND
jgi:HK97 family phage portal protein